MDHRAGRHAPSGKRRISRPDAAGNATDRPSHAQLAAAPPQAADRPAQPAAVSGPAVYQGADEPVLSTAPQAAGGITWMAPERIAYHKSMGWYGGLGAAAIVIVGAVWLATKDVFVTVMIGIGLALLGVYASRQPQQETHTVDDDGLTIGRRAYPYHDFRAFALVAEGAFTSIELVPLRPFATPLTIYYDPSDEDRIVGLLSAHLPMEPSRPTLTDQVLRWLRF